MKGLVANMILGNTPDKVSNIKYCPYCKQKMHRTMRDETTTGFIPGFFWDWHCTQCDYTENGGHWNEEGNTTNIIHHWRSVFDKE